VQIFYFARNFDMNFTGNMACTEGTVQLLSCMLKHTSVTYKILPINCCTYLIKLSLTQTIQGQMVEMINELERML
jgi:hypothetical protein